MAKTRKDLMNVVDLSEDVSLEQVPSGARPSKTTRALSFRRTPTWQIVALVSVSSLLLLTVGVAFYAFQRVGELNQELGMSVHRVEEKLQSLDAGISFDSRRQQLLIGIRDEIMKANPRVSLNQAYEYSRLILQASDKYPSVDPLIFLAVGIVESGYNATATSHANARGLYQIWPSTGRLLARTLNWEYSDDMRMVLAEYNGGPLNAGYLRAGSSRAAAETRDYVMKVGDVYDRLKNKFERGIDVKLEPMHRDSGRDGKLLGIQGQTARTTYRGEVADAAPGASMP
jgi:Transglycosylase SLT domain